MALVSGSICSNYTIIKWSMKKLLILFFLTSAVNANCQDWPVKKMVTDARARGVNFTNIPAFSFIANRSLNGRGVYQELSLNNSFRQQLLEQRPAAVTLTIPVNGNQSITCELVKFSLGNLKFTQNNDAVVENIKLPVTYRGIVAGELNKNTVTLTVNEDYLSLVAAMPGKAIQIAQADENNPSVYRLYNSAQVVFPAALPLQCGTQKNEVSQTSNGIQLNGVMANPSAFNDKCVNVFVDCFDSLFIKRNSNYQQTVNYVYELFNLVATGFYNDTVNIQVTGVNVWTVPDNFRNSTSKLAVYDLGAYWQDNFFGNLCIGLDFTTLPIGRGGRAGDIGRIKAVSTNTCPAYNAADSLSACVYADLNFNGNTLGFPTGLNVTGPQVLVTMHEIGHQLGSRHTHWCGWKLSSNPDVYGAIDSCAAPEGNCPKGLPPPPSGGTIMSYCHLDTLEFVNYNKGFGNLPGTAIRNFIDQSACLLLCTDCFGMLNFKGYTNTYAYQRNPISPMREPNDIWHGKPGPPALIRSGNEEKHTLNPQSIRQ